MGKKFRLIPVEDKTGKKLDTLKLVDGHSTFDSLLQDMIGDSMEKKKDKRLFKIMDL